MIKADRYELAARALCRFNKLPENTMFEGRPMWQSFLSEATAAVDAAFTADELAETAQDSGQRKTRR